MNDFNRRGFLGTLIASVAGLFAGKRTEAKVPEAVYDGKEMVSDNVGPAFVPGDIVGGWAQLLPYPHPKQWVWGVVLDWSDQVTFDSDERWYRIDTAWGLVVLPTGELRQQGKIEYMKPGDYCWYDHPIWDDSVNLSSFGGCPTRWEHSKPGPMAYLCKPTQSVKAGQLLSHWNLMMCPSHRDIIGPAVNFTAPDRKETILGFATSDVTILQDCAGGNDARPPRDWCWCLPQPPLNDKWAEVLDACDRSRIYQFQRAAMPPNEVRALFSGDV